MNTPIKTEKTENIPKAAKAFLACVRLGILEAEETASKLRAVESAIKAEILGENLTGMAKVLDAAGPALESEEAVTMIEAANAELNEIIADTIDTIATRDGSKPVSGYADEELVKKGRK